MNSFLAKIGWKRMRKRENKNNSKDLLCHWVFHGGSHCLLRVFFFLVCILYLDQAPFSWIQMGVGMCFLNFGGAMMPEKKPIFIKFKFQLKGSF